MADRNNRNIKEVRAKINMQRYMDERPLGNFMYVGGDDYMRNSCMYFKLQQLFLDYSGPVIVLHQNPMVEAWMEQWVMEQRAQGNRRGFADFSAKKPYFHPFLNMSEFEAVNVVRMLAASQGRKNSENMETYLKGMIHILNRTGDPIGMKALRRLADEDVQTVAGYAKVLSLVDFEQFCRRNKSADAADGRDMLLKIFDLFQGRIKELCDLGSEYTRFNLKNLADTDGMILIEVTDRAAPQFLTYLTEEISELERRKPFVILDNVMIRGSRDFEGLIRPKGPVQVGVSYKDPDTYGSEEVVKTIFSTVEDIFFFRQETENAAKTVAEQFGKYYHRDVTNAKHKTRERWDFLGIHAHVGKAVTVKEEQRWKVEPDELRKLGNRQAFTVDPYGMEKLLNIVL